MKKVIGLLLFLSVKSYGAVTPIDLSTFSQEPKTIYYGQLGFKIHANDTNWYQISSHLIKSKTIQAEYRSLDDENPSKLTVRSESLKKDLALSDYIRRASKDYRRFGFKILDIRPLNINENKSFVLDLEKEDSELQTRQILFKRNNNVIILTCTGQRTKFQSDLKACNQIARNFDWVKTK